MGVLRQSDFGSPFSRLDCVAYPFTLLNGGCAMKYVSTACVFLCVFFCSARSSTGSSLFFPAYNVLRLSLGTFICGRL
jgi:hypothetical protein